MTFDLGSEGHMNIFQVGGKRQGIPERRMSRAKGQGQSFADSHVVVHTRTHAHECVH